MPALVAILWGALYNLMASLVGRALVALGLSVITYTGMNMTIGWLKTQAVAALFGMPGEVLGILGLLKVGVCISIIFSAIATRLISQGLNSDALKKWVLK